MWEMNGNYKGCTGKSRGNPCFQGSYGKLQKRDMEIQGKIRADLKLFHLQLLDFSISMLVYWRVHCKEISCSTSLSLEDTPPFWLTHNFPTSEFGGRNLSGRLTRQARQGLWVTPEAIRRTNNSQRFTFSDAFGFPMISLHS